MYLLIAAIMSFMQEKPAEAPKEKTEVVQLCWEDIILYEDSEFKNLLPADDDIAKKFKEKRPKYEKTVKQEAAQITGMHGGELVECPDHLLKDSGLKAVAKEANPYHFKVKLAYDGTFVITIYAKVEIFRDGKLIAEFKDEKDISIFRMASREKRRKAIRNFGNKLIATMIEKIKEVEKEAKK